MQNSTTKSVTFKLPEQLYVASSAVARRRRISMDTLLQESLASVIREEEQVLYDSFTVLGDDPEGTDVEFAFLAQVEAIYEIG
jgi:hypothetical protein